MLAPGGALARAFGSYENRPSQRQMADSVADALSEQRPLLVEAGTGTGKTLAYLVPALASGKTVVISTGTRALQEQLAVKDIALLREMSGTAVRASVLKGTSNYVCRRRLSGLLLTEDAELTSDLESVLGWVASTEIGDRSELATVAETAPIWGHVTTAADGRLGPRCPHIDRCFVAKARKRAERSELVIVNHHLFFTDFALRQRGFGARVLPDYDAVIFDEAHQIEDVIATHMGPSISTRGITALCAELTHRDSDKDWIERRLIDWLTKCAEQFFTSVAKHTPELDRGRCDIPDQLFNNDDVKDAWLRLDTALDEVATSASLQSESQDDVLVSAALYAASVRADSMRVAAAEIAEPLEAPCGQWIEATKTGIKLCAAPASAGAVIADVINETPATVFTSATLTTEGKFSFIRSRLGLSEDRADELALASPFDYSSQALLYVPRDLAEPGTPSFEDDCNKRLLELARLCGGGVFGLFTSWRALDRAADSLRSQRDFQLLVQGEAPKAALIDQFRTDGNAILLATSSFWEGVDVAGEALRCVVINRLPFSVPTDPLHSARMKRIDDRGGDAFAEYQLPSAALHLKQGFGRLIRSRTDRGVVAVLDRRLVSRRYGRTFFDTLPLGLPRTSALEQVRRFWVEASRETETS